MNNMNIGPNQDQTSVYQDVSTLSDVVTTARTTTLDTSKNQGNRGFSKLAVAAGVTVLALSSLVVVSRGGEDSNRVSAVESEDTADETAEDTSTDRKSPVNTEEYTVLPGNDSRIASEAARGAFQCGAELNDGVWNVNFEPALLNMEDNKDLLESKSAVLIDKIGIDAVEIFANGSITNPNARDRFSNSSDLYTRILARAIPQDVDSNEHSHRLNYYCDQTDGSGIGDESKPLDIRNNDGETKLLGAMYTPEEIEAAREAAASHGVNLDDILIMQNITMNLKDKDGNIVEKEVVIVFFEDDDCGNQVFVANPPEKTPIVVVIPTPTTGPGEPTRTPLPTATPTAGPTATPTTPPKHDDDVLPGDSEVPADHDPGVITNPGQGPADQESDDEGYVDGAVRPSPQPTVEDTDEQTDNEVDLPPATVAPVQPTTGPAVIANNNPTGNNPENGPLPEQP